MLNFMFWKKRRTERDIDFDKKEAEIQAVRQDTIKKIEKATHSFEKVERVLTDNDIVENIYNATGGDRRGKR